MANMVAIWLPYFSPRHRWEDHLSPKKKSWQVIMIPSHAGLDSRIIHGHLNKSQHYSRVIVGSYIHIALTTSQ